MKIMLMTMLATMAASGFAQEATPDTWMREAASAHSRADVHAQAMAAMASGEITRLNSAGDFPAARHPRLRAEVVAELYRARQSGELAAIHAEAFDFAAVPHGTAYASRALLARRR